MENKITAPFFSIVVYGDRVECIEKMVNSIFSEKNNWDKVQVLILDTECSVDSITNAEMLRKKFGDSIEYYYTKNMTMGEAYNYAISRVRGYYVNFTLASSFFNEDTLEHIYYCAHDNDKPLLISMAPWTVDENGIFAQYTQSPRIYDGKKKTIDLDKEPGFLSLCLHSYFMRRDILLNDNLWFEELGYDTTMQFLIRILQIAKKYLYISYAFYNYTVSMEDNKSSFLGQYDEKWYLEYLEKAYHPIITEYVLSDKEIPEYIQKIIIWNIYVRFNCNYNDANKGILKDEKLNLFYKKVGQLLSYLDDEYVWKKNKGQSYAIPRTIKMHLLKCKANYMNKTYSIAVKDDCLYGNFGSKDIKLCTLKNEHVIIDIINFDKGKLSIDGRCSLGDFGINDDVKVYMYVDKKCITLNRTNIYLPNKLFGLTYQKKYRFSGEFYSFGDAFEEKVCFEARINGTVTPLKIKIGSIYSRVSLANKFSYWRFAENGIMYIKDNQITISSLSNRKIEEREYNLQKSLSDGTESEKYASYIRKRYFELLKNKKKPIWLSFDKLYKAGDSGEYMMDYVTNNKTGIDMYYIVKQDAPDYNRLISKYGDKILVWGEERTILTALQADVILATHTSITSNLGIMGDLSPYVSDLFTPINVCIQHGLTVQNIAQYQNRVFDNTEFYVCASQNEVNNILQPVYGYTSDMVELTGLARYDGLKDKAKKQILITPTWRRNIANSNTAHFKKAHNEFFKHSEYFRIYNSLINDTKLINDAKKYGYKIIYLIHPAVSSQIDDFDKNPYVDIIPAAGDMNYEKILTESSLMVTDYSGVQFDFAYMKKPILYYHPETLPPHYDESEAYKYDRDAFGPIIKQGDKLVDELCTYMKNNCQMKDEYKKRVDSFFAFSDFDSCERIYSAVEKFVNKRKGIIS